MTDGQGMLSPKSSNSSLKAMASDSLGFRKNDADQAKASKSQSEYDDAESGNQKKVKKKGSNTMTRLEPPVPNGGLLLESEKRTIFFPKDKSLGDLYLVGEDGRAKFMGEAVGEVGVFAKAKVFLYYSFDQVYGCSRLSKLSGDAFYGISFLGTEISDDDLQFIEHLQSLEELDISCTQLSDQSLHYVTKLRNLRKLNLSSTRISNEGVASLASLPELNELILDDTRLNDGALALLSRLGQLTTLSLSFTDITSRGLSQIKGMKNLRKLRLNSTSVSNAGIDFLTRLSKLEELWLRSTNVSYPGLAELTKWLPDCQIII
jgi:Leucine-rich repeat (LRR) protein